MSDDSSARADEHEPNAFRDANEAAKSLVSNLITLKGLIEPVTAGPTGEQVKEFKRSCLLVSRDTTALGDALQQVRPQLEQVARTKGKGKVSGCGVSSDCAHDTIYRIGENVTSLLILASVGGPEAWVWSEVLEVFASIDKKGLKRLEALALREALRASPCLMPRGNSTPRESDPPASGDDKSEAAAAGDSQTKAESDVSAGEVESETPEALQGKRPPENALTAWRLRDLQGINDQTNLAKEMIKLGVPATQGQVSRWLKQVEEYLKAGNILPDLKPMRHKPDSVDPAVIEMGQRQDNRTPRQRSRRDPDSDE